MFTSAFKFAFYTAAQIASDLILFPQFKALACTEPAPAFSSEFQSGWLLNEYENKQN